MSDFLTLVQQLQREVGVQGAAISTVEGQSGMRNKLVNWIADADVFIQGMHLDWKFLWSQYQQATVVANAKPPVPSDLCIWDRESFYLDYTLLTRKKLTTIDYIEWRKTLRQGAKTNAKPSYAVIQPDNSIILDQPPDGVYSLTADYWKSPVKMVDNTDVTVIPVAFHRIIVIQAKLWYAEEQEIPTVYQAADIELNGNRQARQLGLMQRLESLQLPEQERRTMGVPMSLTTVVE